MGADLASEWVRVEDLLAFAIASDRVMSLLLLPLLSTSNGYMSMLTGPSECRTRMRERLPTDDERS